MKWFLILWIGFGPGANMKGGLSFVPFNSQKACETALVVVKKKSENTVKGICVNRYTS